MERFNDKTRGREMVVSTIKRIILCIPAFVLAIYCVFLYGETQHKKGYEKMEAIHKAEIKELEKYWREQCLVQQKR